MDKEDINVVGNTVVYTTENDKPHNPLNRPKINYSSFVLALSVYLILMVFIYVFCKNYNIKYIWLIMLLFSIFVFLIIGKRAVIWLVHLYQNKASDETRLKCLFEPSCSEYMILALEKYGLIRGLYKGIRRLLRCHYPNGGVDYP